jgi:Ca2+-binding RTX toxin-like protein
LVIGVDDDNAQISSSPGVDNTIVAGLGNNQQLTGGGSTDIFVFFGGGHNDTITDFNPQTDTIAFENTMSPADFSQVTIAASGNGSTVSFENNTIQVAGVAPGQLTSSQFLFNQTNPALLAQQQQQMTS